MIYRLVVGLGLLSTVALGALAYRSRDAGSHPSRVDADLAGADGKPWTLLAFTSPICGACKETPSIVAEALDVPETELGRGPVGFRQVDVTESPGLAEALDVTRTPAVALVDHEGEVRYAREGNPEPDELATVLKPPVGA